MTSSSTSTLTLTAESAAAYLAARGARPERRAGDLPGTFRVRFAHAPRWSAWVGADDAGDLWARFQDGHRLVGDGVPIGGTADLDWLLGTVLHCGALGGADPGPGVGGCP